MPTHFRSLQHFLFQPSLLLLLFYCIDLIHLKWLVQSYESTCLIRTIALLDGSTKFKAKTYPTTSTCSLCSLLHRWLRRAAIADSWALILLSTPMQWCTFPHISLFFHLLWSAWLIDETPQTRSIRRRRYQRWLSFWVENILPSYDNKEKQPNWVHVSHVTFILINAWK